MKKWKSWVAAYLSGILLLTSFSTPTMAAELTGVQTNNVNGHSYGNWSSVVKSYLIDNGDGTLTRVEASKESVFIEKYNEDGVLQEKKVIENELPRFGGFYSGDEYNFIVYGQDNGDQDNEKEVIRVVQYTKDWEKKGTASLYGANTVMPFNAGSLRMTQYGDILYVRTSHKMYKSYDGKNHQANLTFTVDIPSMTVKGQVTGVSNIGTGYVSHSFNQFITTDDSVLLAADHGDAYPRAIVLIKYKNPAGTQNFSSACNAVNVLKFKGGIGANATGAALGGLVSTGSSYLVAGNSVAQDETYNPSNVRNIFVTSTSKDNFSTDGTKINWITSYEDKQTKVSNPYLVKFSDDKVLLLYMINDEINYVFLNAEGEPVGDIKTMEGKLSDCEPIVVDDTAVWYYTSNSTPVFCRINSDGSSDDNQGSTGGDNQGSTGGDDQDNSGDNIEHVSLNYNSYQLQVGQTVQLTAKVTGTVATSSNANKVTWSSSNSDIASVDTTGLVKGLKAGAATITVKVNDGEATCKITVKSLAPSRGSASTRGSNSTHTTKVTNNTNSQNNSNTNLGSLPSDVSVSNNTDNQNNSSSNLGSLPNYVSKGTWKQNSNGTWSFTNSNGTVPKNSWGAIANPYANTSAGQAAFDWFFFDDRGNMRTGWFTDADGNVYYLNESSDGTKGRMMTGWCWVTDETGKQKCYYLNPLSDGTKGKLMVNTTIDGHTVNEKGEWVINGVVQTK